MCFTPYENGSEDCGGYSEGASKFKYLDSKILGHTQKGCVNRTATLRRSTYGIMDKSFSDTNFISAVTGIRLDWCSV
jgi:hypothetical protein